jgi:putative transcriptional regulator
MANKKSFDRGSRPGKIRDAAASRFNVREGCNMGEDPTVHLLAADALAGQLLVAMPSQNGSPFGGAVIYLCAHSPGGAMGVVLNRPLSHVSFDNLLSTLAVTPSPPQRRVDMRSGGPLEPARGFVLHTDDWISDGNSMQVEGGIALTASLDVLQALAEGGGPRQCFLALGYTGWAPGQLDREMVEGYWLNTDFDQALVFDGDCATKWRRTLLGMKIDPARLSATAGHA